MGRTKLATSIVLSMLAGLLVVFAGTATAHECWDADDPPPEFQQHPGKGKGKGQPGNGNDEFWRDGDKICRDTTVMPNWRDNYVPLFDLEDREDEQQRHDAQRWRDECNPRQNEYHQMCMWNYGGFSFFENRDDPERAPNEWHAGFAASHCFLFEAAHQCEDHEAERGEGVHDAHGGALYVDVCLTPNPESKYCQDGLEGTQVGVTIMDHNPCGLVVPIVACTDEYHVVRPFDVDYTQRQMENSEAATRLIVEDPPRYVCGTHASGQSCRNNLEPTKEITGPIAGALP